MSTTVPGARSTERKLLFAALGGVMLALAIAATSSPGTSAAAGPVLGIDPYVIGNTPTALGPSQKCVSVDRGDVFPVDIWITDVESLKYWELYLEYDADVVMVQETDVQMFLAAEPGSKLLSISEPNRAGRYFLGATDFGGSPPESGSGTLARVTLEATGSGLTSLDIPLIDVDGGGTVELGPRLKNGNGDAVGDETGDGVFDGTIVTGLVAVDQQCPSHNSSPAPTPKSSGPAPSATTGGGDPGSGGGSDPTDGPQVANVDPEEDDDSVLDPLEDDGGTTDNGGDDTSGAGDGRGDDPGGPSAGASDGSGGSWLIWAALGAVALIALGAGGLFAVSRMNRGY